MPSFPCARIVRCICFSNMVRLVSWNGGNGAVCRSVCFENCNVIRYWVFVVSNEAAAISVIERLRDEGFEALLAGGCVRDRLLGREAKDYDVATSAEPAQVMGLFKRTLEVGARFGVVIVMMGQDQIEVATFRSDAEYVDGRRPTQVHFTTAQEDAARRDFTINGMFYDPVEDRLIDYVGGEADLKKSGSHSMCDPPVRLIGLSAFKLYPSSVIVPLPLQRRLRHCQVFAGQGRGAARTTGYSVRPRHTRVWFVPAGFGGFEGPRRPCHHLDPGLQAGRPDTRLGSVSWIDAV